MIALLMPIQRYIKTITFDNGKEFSKHNNTKEKNDQTYTTNLDKGAGHVYKKTSDQVRFYD